MLEIIDRRTLFKLGIASAGAAVVAPMLGVQIDRLGVIGGALSRISGLLRTREAQAQEAFPSWNPSKQIPETNIEGMQGYTVVTQSKTATELIVGPLKYRDLRGRELDFRGQRDGEDGAGVVLINGGTPGLTFNLWGNGEGQGNWLGTTKIPGEKDKLSLEQIRILAADANKSLRDPALGNGKDRNGVKGRIDFALIDGATGIIDAEGIILLDGSLIITYGALPVQPEHPVTSQQPSQVVQQPVATQVTAPALSQEPAWGPLQDGCPDTLGPNERCVPWETAVVAGDHEVEINGRVFRNLDNDPTTGNLAIVPPNAQIRTRYNVSITKTNRPEEVASRIEREMLDSGCGSPNGCNVVITSDLR